MTLRYHSFIDPHVPRGVRTQFVDTTLDIAAGLSVALELVYTSYLEQTAHKDNPGNPPSILSVEDTEKLMRFAITASRLLEEAADEQVEWLNETHGREEACPGS